MGLLFFYARFTRRMFVSASSLCTVQKYGVNVSSLILHNYNHLQNICAASSFLLCTNRKIILRLTHGYSKVVQLPVNIWKCRPIILCVRTVYYHISRNSVATYDSS